MCGIVGYVSLRDQILPREKKQFMRDALILDTFRGEDSTGVITVCEDFKVDTLKSIAAGYSFVGHKKYQAMQHGWAMIGHNRAATIGNISHQNAHPFRCDPITLVHNGTLRNKGRDLPGFSEKLNVDSEAICCALAEVEPGEAAQEVLRMIEGSYAVVWTDTRDQSINFARNHNRPLHFAYNNARTIMWYMSDGKHLELLKDRRWCASVDMGPVYRFAAHQHLKWRKGNMRPEVVEYDPFIQARSTKSSTTGTAASANRSSKGSKSTTPGLTDCAKRGVPVSHRIMVNGKIDSVPEELLEELSLATDLTPDDHICFEPYQWMQYADTEHNPRKHGVAIGLGYVPMWDAWVECQVHNVPKEKSDKIALNEWRVIPYAITANVFDEKEDAAIMARPYRYEAQTRTGNKEYDRYDVPAAVPTDLSDAQEMSEDDETEETYIGPFGHYYSASSLERMLKHGCAHCSCDLDVDDAEEIWWANDKDPICDKCSDMFFDPESEENLALMADLSRSVH